MVAIRLEAKLSRINVKKLKDAIKLKVSNIREQIRSQLIPKLKERLNKKLLREMGPLVEQLANSKFDAISLGGFGIPRSGGFPRIRPDDFKEMLNSQAVTTSQKTTRGGRLNWFDFGKAYAETQYIWKGRTGREVSWLRLLEEGDPEISGYLFIGRPGVGRSTFGHMIKDEGRSRAEADPRTRNIVANWSVPKSNRIKNVEDAIKETEDFVRKELEALIVAEFKRT